MKPPSSWLQREETKCFLPVARSQLTATFTSRAQVLPLPQPPE
uniref:Macaca fascicularis brain cDNA clone: QmoA-12318, similar to human hypothetical gene supported by BC034803 (LOC401098), mRNA, RefSeq: XM_379231.1 n=1 Tax=Macaca fascicularis TaxID=9541 RepID=I7GJ71_MACFA|nr:unnamed protein product [Macaca fascicularis]